MKADNQNVLQKSAVVPISIVDLWFVVIAIWFGSYAYQYIFTVGGPKPLLSYIALVAFSIFNLALLIYKNGISSAMPLSAVTFVVAMLGYLAYGHIAFMFSSQSAAAVQGYITLVESVLIAFSLLVLFWSSRRTRLAANVFVFLCGVAIILNVWDFVLPAFSNVPGRAAGLYENPNMSGTFIVLAMVAGIGALPVRLRNAFVILCGFGVLITFSRGAWMTYFIGVFGLAVTNKLRMPGPYFIVAGTTVVILCAALFGSILTNIVYVADELMAAGLLTPNAAARLGIGGDVFSGFAAYDRLTVAKFAFDQFEAAPFFGHGLSFTEEWNYPSRPHNMFLLLAVEGGLFGLAIYSSLLAALWICGKGVGRVLVVLLVFSGLFSHNHLEQPTIIMIMAFICAHGFYERHSDIENRSGIRPGTQ